MSQSGVQTTLANIFTGEWKNLCDVVIINTDFIPS